MTEFDLSKKRMKDFTDQTIKYHERDVKEFIRLLKEYIIKPIDDEYGTIQGAVNYLAGEKLI